MTIENLHSSIQKKEAQVMGKSPEENLAPGADNGIKLVSEKEIYDTLKGFEEKVSKSALKGTPFEEKIKGKLEKSTESWKGKFDKFKAGQGKKIENQFKALFASTLEKAKQFEKRPKIATLIENVEPFLANTDAVKSAINFTTYKRNSGHWKKINADIYMLGITRDQIRGLQKFIGVKVDGEIGPRTITKINEKLFNDKSKIVNFSDETIPNSISKEDFERGHAEIEKAMESEQWQSLNTNQEKELKSLNEENPETVEKIEEIEKQKEKIKAKCLKAKQDLIAQAKEKAAKAAKAAAQKESAKNKSTASHGKEEKSTSSTEPKEKAPETVTLSDFEASLPENLRGQGFYKDKGGFIRRKNSKGYYKIFPETGWATYRGIDYGIRALPPGTGFIEPSHWIVGSEPRLEKILPENLKGKGLFYDEKSQIRTKGHEGVFTLRKDGSFIYRNSNGIALLPAGADFEKDHEGLGFAGTEFITLNNGWKHNVFDEALEKTLPGNLKGKGFYKTHTGQLKRKGLDGIYTLQKDGSLLRRSNEGLFLLPKGLNVDKDYKEFSMTSAKIFDYGDRKYKKIIIKGWKQIPDEILEKTLPDKLKNQGFYRTPAGQLKRKGSDGIYKFIENGILEYKSPTTYKTLPKDQPINGKWEITKSTLSFPEWKAQQEKPKTPKTPESSDKKERPEGFAKLYKKSETVKILEKYTTAQQQEMLKAAVESVELSDPQKRRLVQIGMLKTILESIRKDIKEGGRTWGEYFKQVGEAGGNTNARLLRIDNYITELDDAALHIKYDPNITVNELINYKIRGLLKSYGQSTKVGTTYWIVPKTRKTNMLDDFADWQGKIEDAKSFEELKEQQLALVKCLRNNKDYGSAQILIEETLLGPYFKAKAKELSVAAKMRIHEQAKEKILGEVVGTKLMSWYASGMTQKQVDAYKEELIKQQEKRLSYDLIAEFKNGMPFDVSGIDYQIMSQYKDMMGTGEWHNLSDATWDSIIDELIINAPMIIISGGIAGLAAKGLSAAARAVIATGRFTKIGLTLAEGAEAIEMTGALGKALYWGGRGAGMLAEGAIFEITHTGLQGENLFDADFPEWAERIVFSAATLGAFHWSGAKAKSITEKLSKRIAGMEGVSAELKSVLKTSQKLAIKGNLEAATMLTTGVVQRLYGTLAHGNEFDMDLLHEVLHAYMSVGALKVSGKGLSIGKKIFFPPTGGGKGKSIPTEKTEKLSESSEQNPKPAPGPKPEPAPRPTRDNSSKEKAKNLFKKSKEDLDRWENEAAEARRDAIKTRKEAVEARSKAERALKEAAEDQKLVTEAEEAAAKARKTEEIVKAKMEEAKARLEKVRKAKSKSRRITPKKAKKMGNVKSALKESLAEYEAVEQAAAEARVYAMNVREFAQISATKAKELVEVAKEKEQAASKQEVTASGYAIAVKKAQRRLAAAEKALLEAEQEVEETESLLDEASHEKAEAEQELNEPEKAAAEQSRKSSAKKQQTEKEIQEDIPETRKELEQKVSSIKEELSRFNHELIDTRPGAKEKRAAREKDIKDRLAAAEQKLAESKERGWGNRTMDFVKKNLAKIKNAKLRKRVSNLINVLKTGKKKAVETATKGWKKLKSTPELPMSLKQFIDRKIAERRASKVKAQEKAEKAEESKEAKVEVKEENESEKKPYEQIDTEIQEYENSITELESKLINGLKEGSLSLQEINDLKGQIKEKQLLAQEAIKTKIRSLKAMQKDPNFRVHRITKQKLNPLQKKLAKAKEQLEKLLETENDSFEHYSAMSGGEGDASLVKFRVKEGNKFDVIRQRFDELNAEIKSLKERISEVKQKIEPHRLESLDFARDASKEESHLEKVGKSLETKLEEKIADIEKELEQERNERIVVLKGQSRKRVLNGREKRISAIEKRLSEANQDLALLKESKPKNEANENAQESKEAPKGKGWGERTMDFVKRNLAKIKDTKLRARVTNLINILKTGKNKAVETAAKGWETLKSTSKLPKSLKQFIDGKIAERRERISNEISEELKEIEKTISQHESTISKQEAALISNLKLETPSKSGINILKSRIKENQKRLRKSLEKQRDLYKRQSKIEQAKINEANKNILNPLKERLNAIIQNRSKLMKSKADHFEDIVIAGGERAGDARQTERRPKEGPEFAETRTRFEELKAEIKSLEEQIRTADKSLEVHRNAKNVAERGIDSATEKITDSQKSLETKFEEKVEGIEGELIRARIKKIRIKNSQGSNSELAEQEARISEIQERLDQAKEDLALLKEANEKTKDRKHSIKTERKSEHAEIEQQRLVSEKAEKINEYFNRHSFESGDMVLAKTSDGQVASMRFITVNRDGSVKLETQTHDGRLGEMITVDRENVFDNNPHGPVHTAKVSKQIIEEYANENPQFRQTLDIINDRNLNFEIKRIIAIGRNKYFIGPTYVDHNGRMQAIMLVDRGDGTNRLYPRIMYKSMSQSGWRGTQGTELKKGSKSKRQDQLNEYDFRFRKGIYESSEYHTYSHETRVDDRISDYLDMTEREGQMVDINIDPAKAHFFDRDVTDHDTYRPRIFQMGYERLKNFFNFHYSPGHIRGNGKGDFGEYLSHLKYPQGFLPDFSKPIGNPKVRHHQYFGDYKAYKYEGTLAGEKVVWQMAVDSENRVWIDSIKLKDVDITSYGTDQRILPIGALGHKPAEYSVTIEGLREGNDKITLDNTYSDITPSLDMLLPVRQFRRANDVYRHSSAASTSNAN